MEQQGFRLVYEREIWEEDSPQRFLKLAFSKGSAGQIMKLCQAVVLKVWFQGQQYQCHLGTCDKCIFPGPASELLWIWYSRSRVQKSVFYNAFSRSWDPLSQRTSGVDKMGSAYVWLWHKETKWGISLDGDGSHLLEGTATDRIVANQFPTAHSWKLPGCWWVTVENPFHAFWLWPAPWDDGVEIEKEAQKVWNTSNLRQVEGWERLVRTNFSSLHWFSEPLLWVHEAHTVPGISVTESTPESDYYKPQFLTLATEFLPFPSNLLSTSQPYPLHPFSKGERYIDTPVPALMTEAVRKLRHTSDTDFPNSPGMERTDAPQMQHEQMQQKIHSLKIMQSCNSNSNQPPTGKKTTLGTGAMHSLSLKPCTGWTRGAWSWSLAWSHILKPCLPVLGWTTAF